MVPAGLRRSSSISDVSFLTAYLRQKVNAAAALSARCGALEIDCLRGTVRWLVLLLHIKELLGNNLSDSVAVAAE